VIDAEPGAKLISGLKERITPDDYVRLVAEDRITEVLAEHAVAPGDVFFLPSGRIHSIGGGCFLAEIQQTSDITYRIYDYNRPGLDGKPRQLHTQEAKDAIDYEVYENYRTPYALKQDAPIELVKCEHFTTMLYDFSPAAGTAAAPAPLSGSASLTPDPIRVNGCAGALPLPAEFLIAIGLKGSGVLRTERDETTLSAGEAVLIPASDGSVSVEPGPDGLRMMTTHP
jgi:mannose-6-phosphate isomerase